MNRAVIAVLTLSASLAAVPASGQTRGGVAYISMQKVLAESTEAKAAAKRIEDLRRSKQQDIDSKQKALQATQLELANAGGLFSRGRRTALQEKVKRQETELRQTTDAAQKEFQQAQQASQARLLKDLQTVLQDISKSRGIQLVLNTDTAVVWASIGADLTAEVLKRLNGMHKPSAP